MRVLIADNFETSGREGLAALGCDVQFQPKLKDQELADAIRQLKPDVLVVRSTKVTEAMLDAGPLKLVVRAGAGYNTIDVAAASKRGIYVSNCPGKNSIAVAELAFGLILSLDRRIPDNVASLRAGQWNKTEYSKAKGLFGRTLGLVGVGQIGGQMVIRAKAFGMNVVGCDPMITPQRAEEMGFELKAAPLEVAAVSDVVSVHLPLTKDTRGMVNATFFNAMRKGAYFVNTSRGEVVDQPALLAAMREKGIRAGLDVYAAEPATGTAEFTDPAAKEPGLYGTHHIGASTEQAQEAIAAETVRIVKSFMETGQVPNVVNLAKQTPVTCVLAVRHRNRPGVLTPILDAVRTAKLNVQEMEKVVFEGGEAVLTQIHLDAAPSQQLVDSLPKGGDILDLAVINAGAKS